MSEFEKVRQYLASAAQLCYARLSRLEEGSGHGQRTSVCMLPIRRTRISPVALSYRIASDGSSSESGKSLRYAA